MIRILLAVMMFIETWMIPPAVPPAEFDAVYLPIMANYAHISDQPATVSGRILKTDGTPYAGQIVRLAQVICESYDPLDVCYVILDIANDPGDCTDINGEYTLTVRSFVNPVRYSLVVVGNVEWDDYQIIYTTLDDVIPVHPAEHIKLGDITTTVSRPWCRVQSSSPGASLLVLGLDE